MAANYRYISFRCQSGMLVGCIGIKLRLGSISRCMCAIELRGSFEASTLRHSQNLFERLVITRWVVGLVVQSKRKMDVKNVYEKVNCNFYQSFLDAKISPKFPPNGNWEIALRSQLHELSKLPYNLPHHQIPNLEYTHLFSRTNLWCFPILNMLDHRALTSQLLSISNFAKELRDIFVGLRIFGTVVMKINGYIQWAQQLLHLKF